MQDALLDRLQVALDRIVEQNRSLTRECHQLKQEKTSWEQEKTALLADVENALKRFDSLNLEGL